MKIEQIDSGEIHRQVEDFESDNEQFISIIEELLSSKIDEEKFEKIKTVTMELCGVDESEYNEYLEKKQLNEEGNSVFADWADGITLVPEDNFEAFVQEELENVGYFPKDFPSFIVIDWEATADNMKSNYSTIEVDGTTYYGRT